MGSRLRRSTRNLLGFVLLPVMLAGLPGQALALEGDLDPSFGSGGLVQTTIRSGGGATALVRQVDGRLVAGGSVTVSLSPPELGQYSIFGLARYNEDGSLDPTFGSSGVVTTDPAGASSEGAHLRGLALQDDGRIIAAGHLGDEFTPSRLLLARYNPDGSLDPSFGASGVVYGPTFLGAGAVAIQPDGRIVTAGKAVGASPARLVVARFHADGSLDPLFGVGGLAEGPVATRVLAVALQADGGILAAGSVLTSNEEMLVARFLGGGSLDAGFGTGGVVQLAPAFQGEVEGLAVQADGRIVMAGSIADGFGLARLETDGDLDAAFGTGGYVQGPLSVSASLSSVSLRADGRILAGGRHFNLAENRPEWAVVQYQGDGAVDTDFSGDGIHTIASGFDPGVHAVLALTDGRAAAAGTGGSPAGFLLARYLGAAGPIAGDRLVMNARADAAARKRLKVTSRDGARLPGGAFTPADPVFSGLGGTVRVFTSSGDEFDDTYDLPAAGWSYLGDAEDNRGFVYSDTAGPILRVDLRSGRRLKIVGKGEALGHSLAADPAPVVVLLTVGESSYCMTFGGATTFVADRRFRAAAPGLASLCP